MKCPYCLRVQTVNGPAWIKQTGPEPTFVCVCGGKWEESFGGVKKVVS